LGQLEEFLRLPPQLCGECFCYRGLELRFTGLLPSVQSSNGLQTIDWFRSVWH